jgi:hypothetical protein
MAPSPDPSPSLPDSQKGFCHYAELKVASGASPQELRQAFRHLSKLYHPDTTQLPAQQAESAFARLQLAYATLSDPDRRRAYDQQRALVAAPSLRPAVVAEAGAAATAGRRVSVHRALSGGEWLALLLLGVALILSLVLGLGVAWARGLALVTPPSWSVAGVEGAPKPPLGPELAQTAKAEPPTDADAPS